MRARLGALALLVGSVLLSLVLVEGALRMSGRVSTEGVSTATSETFATIPGVFQPGQRVTEAPRPELRHRISINALGYRGPDILPGSGRRRVLCLGDSFTYGSYVDDEQTLPAQLERQWRARGHAVDVINAGLGGTTIVDQLEILRKATGQGLRPQHIVLTFSENDISDLARSETLLTSIERNRRLKDRPGIAWLYRHLRNTALFHLALEARGWVTAHRTAQAEHVDGVEAAQRLEELWARYDRLLGELVAHAEAHGSLVTFLIYPSHYRLGPGGPDQARLERIERIAAAKGLRTINLLAPLRASGQAPQQLYLLPFDGHPSPRGYAVAAAAVAEQLNP